MTSDPRREAVNAAIRARMAASQNRAGGLRASWGALVAGVGVLVVLAFTGGRLTADTSTVYREVEVRDPKEIIRREPVIRPSLTQRILTVPVEPDFRATSPEGGRDRVIEFCRDSRELSVPDTGQVARAHPIDERHVVASIATDRSWLPLTKDRVSLFGLGSSGSLSETQFHTWGGWDVTTGEDVRLRAPRFGLAKEIFRVLLPAAVGYGVCEVGL